MARIRDGERHPVDTDYVWHAGHRRYIPDPQKFHTKLTTLSQEEQDAKHKELLKSAEESGIDF